MNTPFKKKIEKILESLKRRKKAVAPSNLHATLANGTAIKMFVITDRLIEKNKTIALLAQWRDRSNVWFPAQFQVTLEGTKKWAIEKLLGKKDRILFFLQAVKEKDPFGHVGLYRFNYVDRSCEIDNIIRGKDTKDTKGGMTVGLQLLIDWTFTYLGVEKLELRTFSDNKRALSLYERLGFREVDRIPLVKKVEDGIASWIELSKSEDSKSPKRYSVKMLLKK